MMKRRNTRKFLLFFCLFSWIIGKDLFTLHTKTILNKYEEIQLTFA